MRLSQETKRSRYKQTQHSRVLALLQKTLGISAAPIPAAFWSLCHFRRHPQRDPQFITTCMDFWGLEFSIVMNVHETIPTFGSFPKPEMPSRNHMCHIKSTFTSQVAQHYSGEAKTTTLKKYHPVHRKSIFWHWLSFCINNNKKQHKIHCVFSGHHYFFSCNCRAIILLIISTLTCWKKIGNSEFPSHHVFGETQEIMEREWRNIWSYLLNRKESNGLRGSEISALHQTQSRQEQYIIHSTWRVSNAIIHKLFIKKK